MHILIDMDSTIADWGKRYDEGLNTMAGGNSIPRTSAQKAFDLHNGMTKEQSNIIHEVMDAPGFYAELDPIDGAIDALNEILLEGHEVSLVTSPWLSNPTCVQDKLWWVKFHLGAGWEDRVIITKDKTLIDGDILIDDKPEITGKAVPKWEHILFDQPYNAYVSDDKRRIIMWEDWREFIPHPDSQGARGYASGGVVVTPKPMPAINADYVIPSGTLQEVGIKVLKKFNTGEFTDKFVKGTEVRSVSATGGEKGMKLAQMSALDPHSLKLVAEVAGFGAQKYAKLNFMKGYDWSLSYDALQRHLIQFWSGEDRDEESGMVHLAHAAWHCLAMISFYERGLGTDDRYTSNEDLSNLQRKTIGPIS